MWLQPTSHYARTQKLRVSWADRLVQSSNPFRSPLGGERVSWEVKGGEVCWILRHSPLSSSSCLWRKESWICRWSDKAPFHCFSAASLMALYAKSWKTENNCRRLHTHCHTVTFGCSKRKTCPTYTYVCYFVMFLPQSRVQNDPISLEN